MSESNNVTTYFIFSWPVFKFFVLKKAKLYHCQSNLDKTVALRNSSRASASSITQYCVCFSSGATDFLIYLLLPLPSQTDYLSPASIGSPRRRRTPDSFLYVLNTLIFIWSNRCQHLRQSQCSSSFWWSCLCEFVAVASYIHELILSLYTKKKKKKIKAGLISWTWLLFWPDSGQSDPRFLHVWLARPQPQ